MRIQIVEKDIGQGRAVLRVKVRFDEIPPCNVILIVTADDEDTLPFCS